MMKKNRAEDFPLCEFQKCWRSADAEFLIVWKRKKEGKQTIIRVAMTTEEGGSLADDKSFTCEVEGQGDPFLMPRSISTLRW
ncbi:hypothetical protein CDAR_497611 [Caerostris darwini]|uniref:Ig-like domain-containing protein n=1 Tax=Caerostris darwini TaxID=1538125 RepID=A0AAV4S351_9ARAC|nr:hypothetical protein CDAR_497611 [Caerostris darwini]